LLAQVLGSSKKATKKTVYEAPKGDRNWGYRKGDEIMNVMWLERMEPDTEPLMFRPDSVNQYQSVPLTQLLPVAIEFDEVLAGGVYRLSSTVEALVNEWCDHVAEIK
jgi:hypothetical protein